MKKTIYIADPEILSIPIQECHERMIDIKNYKDLAYGTPPECELTSECYTKMRETIFEKLKLAQKELPSGWRFRLYEGFRSLRVQQMLFDQEYQRVKARLPQSDHDIYFHETTRLISPVTNLDGSQNIPPHNTGAAVDIEIIKEDGQLLDMGMAAKDWCVVDPALCQTECQLIDKNAQHNRQFLLDLMQAHGFVNYPTEWWHFSYGDRYWAYHKKAKYAIYGPQEEGPNLLLKV